MCSALCGGVGQVHPARQHYMWDEEGAEAILDQSSLRTLDVRPRTVDIQI